MGSATDSSSRPDLTTALHRLRSTLARLKAELELVEVDGTAPPVDRLLHNLEEAFDLLTVAENANQLSGLVVVVDDDIRLAEITARGLRRLGFAADWGSAVPALREGDVLVFDLGLMATMDVAAVAALRAAGSIVVSGATDPGSRAVAASIGASDYLVKPIELDELATAINRRFAEHRAPGASERGQGDS